MIKKPPKIVAARLNLVSGLLSVAIVVAQWALEEF
jgi:hypothetical protein